MTRLDNFLAYSESHRVPLSAVAGVLVLLIAWVDWKLPTISIGFLYLIPVLLSAAALNSLQILIMAALCSFLREAFDYPLEWAPGAAGRIVVVTAGFAMTGFFVSELNQRRRLLLAHLDEREEQMRLRREAEMQVRVLIETSPLAILTLDQAGRVELANESAHQLLGFNEGGLTGAQVEDYLPILSRILKTQRPPNLRTNVECKGRRQTGEVFLAHVWLSTYSTSGGPGLAAVIWDSSENLRDREGAGFESMMATSRVLIGAISHEIRNLASAASAAHSTLATIPVVEGNEQFQVLGTLIHGLEKIASSGLRAASGRETGAADLGTVLDEVRIVIEPTLREAGITLVWEVDENLPLVQADHHSLLQVFVNLARNSQQALESSPIREVRISTAQESDLVLVRFRDSGPGVTRPEELFRPFQTGAHAFGLGLYISRAILRSHGGGLRYEPQPHGSCFTVELWPVENAVEG
jgi:PAS domain S-box-containing protein